MDDGGAMGSRMAGRLQQGREMGSVHHLIFLILMREIFHILQEFINRFGEPNKVRKSFHLLCSQKGEIGGLTFFSAIFSIVE
jgi:hypothetical protein